MQEMLFCGTGSFKDVDKDAGGGKAAAPGAVKKKKQTGGKKENPYASRGLDKFSTVLSELELRREKILRIVGGGAAEGGGGGGDHVMIRFVQTEGKGWVPIVVKLPAEEEEEQQKRRTGCKKRKQAASSTTSSQSSTPPTSEPASPREEVKLAAAAKAPAAAAAAAVVPAKKAAVAGKRWSLSWGKNVRPRNYMPFVAVLLLASLVVFGKVFAICCTSVWWYLVPILTTSTNGSGGEAIGVRRAAAPKVVKVLRKKVSDKKITGEKPVAPLVAPSHGKKGSSGVHELISPRSHPHGKKG